jgi:hypothetical protein
MRFGTPQDGFEIELIEVMGPGSPSPGDCEIEVAIGADQILNVSGRYRFSLTPRDLEAFVRELTQPEQRRAGKAVLRPYYRAVPNDTFLLTIESRSPATALAVTCHIRQVASEGAAELLATIPLAQEQLLRLLRCAKALQRGEQPRN